MKKNQRNQLRAKKRALYKSKRKKKIRQQKCYAKKFEKKVRKFSSPGKPKLKVRIMNWWSRMMCRMGRHKWTLYSATKGNSKYMCWRCGKFSEEVWE